LCLCHSCAIPAPSRMVRVQASLFSTTKYSGEGGLFYGETRMFGAAIIFILTVSAWSATLSTAAFLALAKLNMLRTRRLPGSHKIDERLDDSTHNTEPYVPGARAAAPAASLPAATQMTSCSDL